MLHRPAVAVSPFAGGLGVRVLTHRTFLVFLFDPILNSIALKGGRFRFMLIFWALVVLLENHNFLFIGVLFIPRIDSNFLSFVIFLRIWMVFWYWLLSGIVADFRFFAGFW